MQEIPELKVITEREERKESINFREMIERRRLLKTKLKLMQIYLIDQDLEVLDRNNLSLSDLNLEDFCLTESYNLYLPIKDKIIVKPVDDKIKLKSYLIYLSYLYNYNFLEIYYNNPNDLYKLIYDLRISKNIKLNIFKLLASIDVEYFKTNMEELNNAEYRENLHYDELRLSKTMSIR